MMHLPRLAPALLLLPLCLPVPAAAQQGGAAQANIARNGPVPGVGPTGSMYDGNNTALQKPAPPPDQVAGSTSGIAAGPSAPRSPASSAAPAGGATPSGNAGANSATATGGGGMSGGGNQSGGEH